MIRRGRDTRRRDVAELNITAFMNLMVILVPFLLITAVFSRMAILELNLPATTVAAQEPKDELALEIIVRSDRIEIGDRNRGLLKTLPAGADGADLDGLHEYLRDEVKARFPDERDATLLLEPEIDYDTLVQVMDTVRLTGRKEAGAAPAELFPDIAIGDAPVRGGT
ncbi:hypothetical protein BH24PSE2_BH24PSE2_17700 [soil metagenome]